MASVSIPKIVIKNLDVNIGAALGKAAREIGEKIQDQYESAITKFYMSYSPKVYDRTYSLYEGAIGIGGRGVYVKKSGKYGYDCGIDVGPENYSYDPYIKDPLHGKQMSVGEVFPQAWEKGVHGFTTGTVAKVHKTQSKDTKWWSIKHKNVPPKSQPPIRIMDASFKDIDNAEYVFGKLYSALDSAGAFLDIV